MKRNYFLSILLSVVSLTMFAQSGEISGKIVDENGEAIPFANISLVENGKPTGTGSTTDFDGFYSIKPLSAGKYDIKFSYIGYTSVIKTGVLVKNDQSTYLDQKLSPSAMKVEEVVIVRYKIPLIDAGATSTQATMTSEDIENLPTRDVKDIASTTAGVTKSKDGNLNFRGARSNGVVYYVDGIRVTGKVNIPVSAIEQIDVITGGVPSKYGEATGGVINLSTKGGARKFTGGVEVLESLDQWRYDLINVNVAGPIIKNKAKDRTILGFAFNAEYQHQLDPTPSAVKMYKLKDDVLESLQKEPLYLDDDVIRLRAENITFDDMEETQINPNVRSHDVRGNLRFDIKLNDNMKISLGANGNYNINHRKIDRYALLNYENNPQYSTINYRGNVRFTHNLKKKANEDGEVQNKGIFQNGFYQAQFGYEKYLVQYEDDSHGDNSFAYGYIGTFKTQKKAVFNTEPGYYNLIGYEDENVLFKPSDVNERGANFTTQYYQILGAGDPDADGFYSAPDGKFKTLDEIGLALKNGKRAEKPYDLWYNTGRQYNGHGIENDKEQFTGGIEGGFDILKAGAESRNKHAISFGVSFEQRIERKYTVNPLGVGGPNGLFEIGERNLNSHLRINQDEGFLVFNGDTSLIDASTAIYPYDTVIHNYSHAVDNEGVLLVQSRFDKSLREKIGASANEYIDMMALPLETFSRDMFSADELLNGGNSVVYYRGYDVYGNRSNDKVSFDDFWHKINDEGEHTRPIAAFSPTYMAGYIEDKFQLKDLTFRIGLRVDRYDASQMVLRDEYSLMGSQTVGEASGKVEGDIPSNIKDNFIIYVDGQDNPKVMGFRDGHTWYNAEGKKVSSYGKINGKPSVLLPEGQGTKINDDVEYDTDLAFEKYQANYNVMPRLQFSFNISDNALFFAHYDVLSQSPKNRNESDPTDYYFQSGATINNPNLKSGKTIDFQLGFKQKLSKSSALTFSAYFKEFKDQIQYVRRDGVYPNSSIYYTYDNVDFGTTKGFEFGYEMRRTNNLKLNVNYTLQFADGTGSDDRTQLDVVRASGGENFRNVSALDYDSRHNINLVIDYRFGEGDDYNGPTSKKGFQWLSNFGVNLLTQLRSGTPYTKRSGAYATRAISNRKTSSTGLLNGSRIGWSFNMDLKINKSFTINVKSKKEEKEDTPLYFDVYLRVDNVLGIANVTDVYKYTGSAEDDGWLGSAQGGVVIDNAHNSQSYKDLYKAGLNTQNNYELPRRIFLGASVNF